MSLNFATCRMNINVIRHLTPLHMSAGKPNFENTMEEHFFTIYTNVYIKSTHRIILYCQIIVDKLVDKFVS